MKKFLFPITLLGAALGFGATSAQAQGKIGYISMDELVTAMPEAKKADTVLMAYRDSLGKTQQEMQQELNLEVQQFIKDSATMPQATKDMKRRELQDLNGQIQSFPQDAQNQFNAKQQQLFDPIQRKAVDAIQAVAKENGYTYIIAKENLIVSPPGDDILDKVKKKLGIQ